MSDQSHSADPKKSAKDRKLFLCFGALAIALAVGFGYSMATIQYQGVMYDNAELESKERAAYAELASKERASLHNRYMRQLGKKDKEIAALINLCPVGAPSK
jgi:hypothetical protein